MEPYQGAATGVGGIVRDILAMGARPVAVMDALRFGPADAPDTRRVLPGVVGGISSYGNSLGLPNIGGELAFDACYAGNPLVNALCVGVMRHQDLKLADASGPGNIDEETGLGVALATNGYGRCTRLDPYAGPQLALAEACRNVAATGARPLAVTNCLNFGSPEEPAVMWQFAEAVRGLGAACAALGLPVTGGNVASTTRLGLDSCVVYVGEEDIWRQALSVVAHALVRRGLW